MAQNNVTLPVCHAEHSEDAKRTNGVEAPLYFSEFVVIAI